MHLFKITSLFTGLSLLLGLGSSLSPHIAALGWLLGTLLSLVAGSVYGLRADSPRASCQGGAIAGGVPILIGCGLAAAFGPVAFAGLLGAIAVGVVAGVTGAHVTRRFALGRG
jgi:hypothetical protein